MDTIDNSSPRARSGPRRRRAPGSRILPWLAMLAALFAPASGASAHHILGIPHYSYDEEYPQTPVLTYKVEMGPHEIQMTGYPGKPEPGEQCALSIYISRLDTGELFDGAVTVTVMRDRLIGQDPVIYGPMKAGLEENVYKFYPRFGEEANYLTRIEFEAEGALWIIDLPMVAGEPGSPWALLGGIAFGLIVFLVVLRAIRIKMRRRASRADKPSPASEPDTIAMGAET